MELVRERGVKVTYACRLFGHCRQAFYQLKAGLSVELGRERLIMENVRAILAAARRSGRQDVLEAATRCVTGLIEGTLPDDPVAIARGPSVFCSVRP